MVCFTGIIGLLTDYSFKGRDSLEYLLLCLIIFFLISGLPGFVGECSFLM